MNVMENAMENATQHVSQKSRRIPVAPMGTAKKVNVEDVIRRVREQAAREIAVSQAEALRTKEEARQQEQAIETVSALLEAEARLSLSLDELNRTRGRHRSGTVLANDTSNKIDVVTRDRRAILDEIEVIKTENPRAYELGSQRCSFRQAAGQMAESNRELFGSATTKDIFARIDVAEKVEGEKFIEQCGPKDPDKIFEWGKQGYKSVWENDETVTDVAVSFKELIEDLQKRNNDSDEKMIAILRNGGFYISSRREDDVTRQGQKLDSELDLFKKEHANELLRTCGEYLTKDGYYVTRLGHGYIVLEHRGDKFLGVRTSDVRAGRALFTLPGGENGRKVKKDLPEIGQNLKVSDLSGIWYDYLRESLKADLEREAAAADRFENAEGLRNVSNVPDLITAYALSQGEVGTAVIDVKVEEKKRLTLRLTGNGKTFFISGHVPGTIEDVDPENRWLKRGFNKDGQVVPMQVEILKRGEWRDLMMGNAWFDRNWQLDRKASELGSVTVSAENVYDVIGLEGKDGLYAISVNDRHDNRRDPKRGKNEPVKEWYTPLGFFIRRTGSTIEPVHHLPGPSTNKMEKLGGKQDIAHATPTMKAILRNVLFSSKRRSGDRVEVPAHLQPERRNNNNEE